MNILPAIDMYEGQAVRLYKGNYDEMTVYDEQPVRVARAFRNAGAEWVHLVDLEGARDGGTHNMGVAAEIIKETGLKAQIGGGVRTIDTIEKYISIGASRVIIGTSAITNERFLIEATMRFGDKIAVAADVKDGKVAIKGWTQQSEHALEDFVERMVNNGVKTIICTDVLKDGAMQGTNRELYKSLIDRFDINILASGGISTLDDIRALRDMGVDGAVIGKAYYTGVLDLAEAILAAK